MHDSIPIVVKVSTYPLELLGSAIRLAEESAKYPLNDGRQIPSPEERAYARGAIFTAFNFVESLLIELSQECLRDPNVNAAVKAEIEDRLKKGRASISRTYNSWPQKLGKPAVDGLPEFANFEALRILRNNLTHPKLDRLKNDDLSQDELLRKANAATAAWAVAEVKKMGRALYKSFGVPVPPEVQ